MGKTEKNGKKITQLKSAKYQKPKDENMGWMKHRSFFYSSLNEVNKVRKGKTNKNSVETFFFILPIVLYLKKVICYSKSSGKQTFELGKEQRSIWCSPSPANSFSVLGLTPWNLSCFEFKFYDTRLPHKFLNWDSQQGRDLATSGRNKKRFQLGQSYSYINRRVWYH